MLFSRTDSEMVKSAWWVQPWKVVPGCHLWRWGPRVDRQGKQQPCVLLPIDWAGMSGLRPGAVQPEVEGSLSHVFSPS